MTGYVFAGFVFWVFCFFMSRYSQMIERRLATGPRARAGEGVGRVSAGTAASLQLRGSIRA